MSNFHRLYAMMMIFSLCLTVYADHVPGQILPNDSTGAIGIAITQGKSDITSAVNDLAWTKGCNIMRLGVLLPLQISNHWIRNYADSLKCVGGILIVDLTYANTSKPPSSSDQQTFITNAANLASYLHSEGCGNIIYEIGNEWNCNTNGDYVAQYYSTASNYVILINAIANAIKNQAPEVMISTAGISESPLSLDRNSWWYQVIQGTDWSKVNFFGFHAYHSYSNYSGPPEQLTTPLVINTNSHVPIPDFDDSVGLMRTWLANKSSSADVLMTEMGWCKSALNNETLRNEYYMRALLLNIRQGIEGAVLFYNDTGSTATTTDQINKIMPAITPKAERLIRNAFPYNPKSYDGNYGSGELPFDAPTGANIQVFTSSHCWSVGRIIKKNKLISIGLWNGPGDSATNVTLVGIPSIYKYYQIANLDDSDSGWSSNKSISSGSTGSFNLNNGPILVRISKKKLPTDTDFQLSTTVNPPAATVHDIHGNYCEINPPNPDICCGSDVIFSASTNANDNTYKNLGMHLTVPGTRYIICAYGFLSRDSV